MLTLRPLQTLRSTKAILYTCSITWAFGKKSGSSFLFSPTDRKDTSPLKDRLEEIEQKLEEIRTKALEPLKLLGSTKAILFTRSTLSPRKGALSVERITGSEPET